MFENSDAAADPGRAAEVGMVLAETPTGQGLAARLAATAAELPDLDGFGLVEVAAAAERLGSWAAAVQAAAVAELTKAPGRRPQRDAAGGGEGRRPVVQVTVAVTTLLGLDDAPAELAGYGPIPASVARRIAQDGVWRRLLTDSASGALLDYGTSLYRPLRIWSITSWRATGPAAA